MNHHTVSISAALHAKLSAFARKHKLTMSSVVAHATTGAPFERALRQRQGPVIRLVRFGKTHKALMRVVRLARRRSERPKTSELLEAAIVKALDAEERD